MSGHDHDQFAVLHERWRAGTATQLDLFIALRDPMRRAARRALRQILSEQPDEYDVDEAVERAFRQLIEKGPGAVSSSLRGFASAMAYNRGRDRARSLVRERERVKNAGWQAELIMPTAVDEEDHERRERLLDRLPHCIEALSPLQRELIDAVFIRLVSLSDWTVQRGTSYESGRRMRIRALSALRTCLESTAATREEVSDERDR